MLRTRKTDDEMKDGKMTQSKHTPTPDYQLDNGLHTASIHPDRHLEILNRKTGDLVSLHGLTDEKMHRLIDVIFNRE